MCGVEAHIRHISHPKLNTVVIEHIEHTTASLPQSATQTHAHTVHQHQRTRRTRTPPTIRRTRTMCVSSHCTSTLPADASTLSHTLRECDACVEFRVSRANRDVLLFSAVYQSVTVAAPWSRLLRRRRSERARAEVAARAVYRRRRPHRRRLRSGGNGDRGICVGDEAGGRGPRSRL